MLGNNIQYYRFKASLTQEQLAEAINKPSSSISNYENNKQIPTTMTLADIAKVLDVPFTCLTKDFEPKDSVVNFMNSPEFMSMKSKGNEYQRKVLNLLQTIEDNRHLKSQK